MEKEQNQYLEKEYILRKQNRLKRVAKVLFITSLFVFFLVGVALGYNMYYTEKGDQKIVQTDWGQATFDIPQSKEMINALVIGIDKSGVLTDTMMVINYNPKTSNVNLISVPRDTIIKLKGTIMKLNAAFYYGKFDMTLKAIRKLTGLPIHYYVAVDTKGFRKVIDTLGGVEFNVPRDMYYYDPYQNLKIDLKKGSQLLDGAKAEQLVRFRRYTMGDLDRNEVQKQFIKALIEQKLNMANLSDVPKMKEVFDTLKTYVKTNITFNDAIKYVVSALKITSDKVNTYRLPGQAKDIYGVSYYVYDKSKTIELLNKLTGLKNEELKQGMSGNNEIVTYDIGIIDSIFPPIEENKKSEDGIDETKNENNDKTSDKVTRNPFIKFKKQQVIDDGLQTSNDINKSSDETNSDIELIPN